MNSGTLFLPSFLLFLTAAIVGHMFPVVALISLTLIFEQGDSGYCVETDCQVQGIAGTCLFSLLNKQIKS